MYKAIVFFTDLQDDNHKYYVGDEFPRHGLVVTAERLKELSSNKNKRGIPVIIKIGEDQENTPSKELVEKDISVDENIESEEPAELEDGSEEEESAMQEEPAEETIEEPQEKPKKGKKKG